MKLFCSIPANEKNHKDFRGCGFGKQIISIAETIAKTLGVTKILLTSTPEATGFYEKLGYTSCGHNGFSKNL